MKTSLFIALAVYLLAAASNGAAKPNVLIILADDQSARDIGAVDPAIHTPNLDRLVERGVMFNNCYIQGGTTPAVCTPSRAMLMTGRNLFHLPQDILSAGSNPSLPVMSTVLAGAGYDTFYCGKHGNTYRPADKSFQQFTVINRTHRQNRDVEAETAENHGFTEPVLSYLADPARSENPFFVFYAPSVPHDPVTPEPQDLELYSGDNLPVLPPNAATSHAEITGFNMRDTNIRPFDFPGLGHFITPLSLDQFRNMTAWYHAYITSFDRQLGRILDELERTGADEDTIIIFSADNGMSVGQQGLIHKESVYEQDIHVPLIICGPGVPEGQRSDALVNLADLFPTLCEKLEIPTPATVQTESFLPSLTDPSQPHHTSMYHGYREEMRALRDGDYKICLFSNGHVRLFDIASDPHEVHDLANEPEHAERVAEMINQARQTGQALDDHPDNMPPAFSQDQQPFWVSFDQLSFDKTIAWSSTPYVMAGGTLKNVMGVDQFDQSGTRFLAVNVGGSAMTLNQTTDPDIVFTATDANLDTSSLTTANATVFYNSTASSNNNLSRAARYNGTPGPSVITLNNLTDGQAYRIQALVADHRSTQIGRLVSFDGVNQGQYANGMFGETFGDSLLVTGTFVADNTGSQSFTVQTTQPDGTTAAGGQLNAVLVHAFERTIVWSSTPYVMAGGTLKATMGIDQFDQSGTEFLAVNVGGSALTFVQSADPNIAFTASSPNLDTSSLGSAGSVFYNNSVGNNALADSARYQASGPHTITLNNLVDGQSYRIQALVADHRNGQSGRHVLFDGVEQGRYANGVANVTWGDSLLMTGTFVADNTGSQSFAIQTTIEDGTTLGGGQLNAVLVHAVDGYADWIANYPGVGELTGFNDDFDSDGYQNGVENFFGTDPSVFTTGLLAGELSGNTFTFTHPLNATPADDISGGYRWSADFGTFHADGESAGGTTVTFGPGSQSGGMVTVTATVTGVGFDRLFVKVVVTRN